MYKGSPDGMLRPLMVPVTQSLPVQLSMRQGRKVPRRQRNQQVLHYGLYQNKNRGYHGHRVGFTSPSPHFGNECSAWQYEGGGLRKEAASGYRLNTDSQFMISTGTDSYLPLLENHTVVNSIPAQQISPKGSYYGYPTEIIPQAHACQSQMGQRYYYYQKPTFNQELYNKPYPEELFFDSRFVNCNGHTQVQFYHSPINESYMVDEKPYSWESTDSVHGGNTEKITVADFDQSSAVNTKGAHLSASASEDSSHDKGEGHVIDRPVSDGEAMAETISNALIATVLGHGSFSRADDIIGQFTDIRQELNELVSSTIQAKKSFEENQFHLVRQEEEKQERHGSSSRNLQTVSTLNCPSIGPLPVNRSGGVGVRRSRRILERSSRATVVSYGTDFDMDEISEDEREAYVSSKTPANVNNNSIFWVKVHPTGCMPINRFMWSGHK